jgi:hypothetical protein
MRPVSEWEEKDIDDLYRGEIEESLTLEYKRSDALTKDPQHRKELFKDVSAMANAAGGIIIYSMKEVDNKPDGTDDGLDPKVVTREQIENLLMSNIVPQIENLLIKSVTLTSKGAGNVAYVLDIPAARSRGPHQAPDYRYYKRYNFKSEPMRDNDVRDLMRRGIDYGRKFGAAFDLFIEISRVGSISLSRLQMGPNAFVDLDKALIEVSPDLRSAGSVLLLMNRHVRNSVGELILSIDHFNAELQSRGSAKVSIESSVQPILRQLQQLSDEVCKSLRVILDQEP